MKTSLTGSLCSGVLISKQWVLAAGFCFDKHTVVEDIRVFTGINVIRNYNDDNLWTVKRIILHENITFQEDEVGTGYPRNDISLIELTEPINVNSKQKPVCLAKPDMRKYAHIHLTGFVKRPGKSSTNFTDYVAHKDFKLKRISIDNCNKIYGDNAVDNKQLCAINLEPLNGTKCVWGIGGPLINYDVNGPLLVGIESWSFGDLCFGKQYPVVATRISGYLKWIKKHINPKLLC